MTTFLNLFQGSGVHALSEALGWTLLHFLWQGSLIAVMLWCTLSLMERRSSDARYGAACVALLAMMVFPLLTFLHLAGEEYNSLVAAPISVDARSVAVYAGVGAGPASWSSHLTPAIDRLMPWLMALWCAGVLVFSCRLAVGLSVAHGWKLQGTEDTPARLQKVFDDLRTRLGVRQAARLVESACVHAPMVIGWLKPVVLLPAGCLAGMSQQQVEALLAHELAHICRNDYFVSVVQSVLEAVLFYHPAVWWISNQVRREREYCCDEMAVGVCGDRLAYAKALSQLEERRALLPDVALGANGGVLTMRIKRLLGYRQEIASANMAWMIVLVVVIAGGSSIIGRFALAESKSASSAAEPMMQAGEEAQAAAQATMAEGERNATEVERQIEKAAEQSRAAEKQLARAQEELARATKNSYAQAADQNQLDEAQKKQLADAQEQVQAALEKWKSAKLDEQMKAVQKQLEKLNSPEFKKQLADAAAAAAAKVNSPEFRKQIEDAQKQMQEKVNSPEFRKQMEDMQNRLQDSKELQAKIQAKLNSPEFKKQIADAQKQAEKFNTPEFRKKMEDMQQEMQKKFNSPEFKKQLEDAQKNAEKFNTPEFRERMQDMQKHVQEEMQKVNSPEYREKLRKMMEDAQKNQWEFKFNPDEFMAQNTKRSPESESRPTSSEQSSTRVTTNSNVHVSGNAMAGQVISHPAPVYPQEAKDHRIQGTVVLKAVIDKEGNVEHLNVVSGPKELMQSALDAVSQWKYKPYLLNGEPTEVETTINVNYSLDNATPSSSPTPSPSPQSSLTPSLLNHPLRLIYRVNPEYTAEAKAAKIQGPVVLNLVVNQQGLPENVRVVRGLNLGLDTNAVVAVRQYRFEPAIVDGRPIVKSVNVEVQYRLF